MNTPLAEIKNSIVTKIGLFDDQNIPDFALAWVNATGLDVGMIDNHDGTFSAPPPLTPAEENARVDRVLDRHFGSDVDEDTQVRNRMAADVLKSIDGNLNDTTALLKVRSNYKRYLRILRGL